MSIEVKITVTCKKDIAVLSSKMEVHQSYDSFLSGKDDIKKGREFFEKLIANAKLVQNGIQSKEGK